MAYGTLSLARVKMADPEAKISIPVFDIASSESSPATQVYNRLYDRRDNEDFRGRNRRVLPDIMAEKCSACISYLTCLILTFF
jgi:hypothetical protein